MSPIDLSTFFHNMTTKFEKKRKEGYTGWNNPTIVSNEEFIYKLLDNIRKKDWIDVANLAAILWWRNNKYDKNPTSL